MVVGNIRIHIDKGLIHSGDRIGDRFGVTIDELKDYIR
jgi:hypothetical protein